MNNHLIEIGQVPERLALNVDGLIDNEYAVDRNGPRTIQRYHLTGYAGAKQNGMYSSLVYNPIGLNIK